MTRTLTQTSHVDYGEVARLAFAAWQKDGALPGRELLYWAEAENQLLATHQWLRAVTSPPTPPGPATGAPPHPVPPSLQAT